MLIGLAGGILSCVGFLKIGPWLADKIALADTCGVNSLHGMPGVAAALISAMVVASAGGAGFPDDYFPAAAAASAHRRLLSETTTTATHDVTTTDTHATTTTMTDPHATATTPVATVVNEVLHDVGINLGDQAVAQLLCVLTTLIVAILAGATGGWMCSLSIWQPPHALFKDDDHFVHATHHYDADWLAEEGDETYEASFDSIKGFLV